MVHFKFPKFLSENRSHVTVIIGVLLNFSSIDFCDNYNFYFCMTNGHVTGIILLH